MHARLLAGWLAGIYTMKQTLKLLRVLLCSAVWELKIARGQVAICFPFPSLLPIKIKPRMRSTRAFRRKDLSIAARPINRVLATHQSRFEEPRQLGELITAAPIEVRRTAPARRADQCVTPSEARFEAGESAWRETESVIFIRVSL